MSYPICYISLIGPGTRNEVWEIGGYRVQHGRDEYGAALGLLLHNPSYGRNRQATVRAIAEFTDGATLWALDPHQIISPLHAVFQQYGMQPRWAGWESITSVARGWLYAVGYRHDELPSSPPSLSTLCGINPPPVEDLGFAQLEAAWVGRWHRWISREADPSLFAPRREVTQ